MPVNSPAPVEAKLEVPPPRDDTPQLESPRHRHAPMKLDTDALQAWKELHPSDGVRTAFCCLHFGKHGLKTSNPEGGGGLSFALLECTAGMLSS